MASQLQIDQATLGAGTPGQSRTDGLAGGELVTLTNVGTGSSTVMRLLWVPPGDTTAVASLGPTGNPKIWTFTPTVSVYGTYLVELVENEGLAGEIRERRVLVVRTPNQGLIIPALNERGNAGASLVNAGVEEIEDADNNAIDFLDAALNALPYASWWRAFHELILAVDGGGGGATGDADGFLSRNLYVDPSSAALATTVLGVTVAAAPTWTTADDIPEGNRFRVVLYGPGGGGSGGCTNSFGNSMSGGAAAGAGARVERWFSRRELIDGLPIAWGLPLGGVGGAGASGSGNLVGTAGSRASADATMGSLLTSFRGGVGPTPSFSSEGGGGGGGEESAGSDGVGINAGGGGDPFGGGGGSTGGNPSLFGGGSGASSAAGGGARTGGGGGGSGRQSAVGLAGGPSQQGPTGGGGGGGTANSAAAAFAGGDGGARINPDLAGALAGTPGADGADATLAQGGMGGGGGDGAVGSPPVTASNGGAGGLGGGGGGGGGSAGATSGSNTAGDGGDGGDSLGIFEAYL